MNTFATCASSQLTSTNHVPVCQYCASHMWKHSHFSCAAFKLLIDGAVNVYHYKFKKST